MNFDKQALLARLQDLTGNSAPSRWLVAFSGGVDSTALLHALASSRPQLKGDVVAVHIDHGLHGDSQRWAEHCRQIASELNVDFTCRKVDVPARASGGIEASARDARYRAFAGIMQAGDCLVSAHHQDDQAETLLLNLLRGCGLAGMAGIGAKQSFSCGWLLRPLLDVSGRQLLDYAERHELVWIDDPSNADTYFGRNFLRNKVFPLLATRWPAVAEKFKSSAELAGEGNQLLRDLADIDLSKQQRADRLSISALASLSAARQRNVLRRALQVCGLPPAPASSIFKTVEELIPARKDAQPWVRWKGGEIRRYRDELFLLPECRLNPTSAGAVLLPDGELLELGQGMGALQLSPSALAGIDPAVAAGGLQLRYRQGGEEIRLPGHDITHKVKNLMQQDGILPWMRDRLPLLYAGNELVAIADLWIGAAFVAQHGLQISWHGRPAVR